MKTWFFVSIFSLVLFAAFLLPLPTLAHSEGSSYETTVGQYRIDIGYSAPHPEAGEAVVFDFGLRTEGMDEPDFSDVWVRIKNESGAVIFASGIHNADFGGPKMSYVFPEAGIYTISARFERGADALAEASFTLSVSNVQEKTNSLAGSGPYVGFAAGFVAGCLAVFVFMRSRLRT